MLRDRLISSAVLISATVVLLWLDVKHPRGGITGFWLLPLLLFFALGTAFDLATMLQASGRAISRHWVLATTALVTLSPCVPMLWPLCGQVYPPNCPMGTFGWMIVSVMSAILMLLFREILAYRGASSGALERTLGGVFASVYVGVPMALLVVIRLLGTTPQTTSIVGLATGSATWGLAALVTTIAATKASDAGAYFMGKSFGKHKMIAHLSPGKTWEGAAGGIALAVIVSYGCSVWLIPWLATVANPAPWWGPLLFGIVCAVCGMIGDLAESLVKRETGVKDSGKWLPGLGGVWDVTDSLIGSVMPAWVMLATGLMSY